MPGDADQVAKAVAGDQAALEQLLMTHYEGLAGFIGAKIPSSLRSHIGAEDILQQAFIRILKDIQTFQPRSEGAFFKWAKAIAEARLKDAIRRELRKKRGGGRQQSAVVPNSSSYVDLLTVISGSDITASSAAAMREGVQALQVALSTLSADEREAVTLRFLEHRSLEEIAEAIGRTVPAVRGLLHRAKHKLRDGMGRASLYFSTS